METMTFVVLQAEGMPGHGNKRVLVEKDEYEADDYGPEGYFERAKDFIKIEEIGEVTITGPIECIDQVYNAE